MGGGGTQQLGGMSGNGMFTGGTPLQQPPMKQIQGVGGTQNVNAFGKAFGWNPAGQQQGNQNMFTGGTPLLGGPQAGGQLGQGGGVDMVDALQRLFGGMGGGGGYSAGGNLMY